MTTTKNHSTLSPRAQADNVDAISDGPEPRSDRHVPNADRHAPNRDGDCPRGDTVTQDEANICDGDDVLIFAYSRAQALADGVLVDAGPLAAEAGFRYPVALTAAAWQACVEVPPSDLVHDQVGRLWDVLHVLRWTINSSDGSTDCLELCVDVADEDEMVTTVHLKSLCGPGDDLEPVITIMLPEED